jgi:Tfp pilus assembly protein PilF/glutathione synthase/RimK-type ligase-like ATP-grasp enzyme
MSGLQCRLGGSMSTAAIEEMGAAEIREDLSVSALFNRGCILQQMGQREQACKAYRQVLALESGHCAVLNNLGNLLLTAGEVEEARSLLSEAFSIYPHDAMSGVNLANLLMKEGEFLASRTLFEEVLKRAPAYQPAHAGLSFVLAQLGDEEQALHHQKIAFQGRSIIPVAYRGEGRPIAVLELIATSGGNTRLQTFLSNSIFQRFIVTAQFWDEDPVLPPHDLIINAIGDADTASAALICAEKVMSHSSAAVINAPEAVMKTGRCTLAKVLAGIPDVVLPRTMSFAREALTVEALSDAGFAFPLLLRSPGFHGGKNFLLLENAEALRTALEELPGRELTAIQFLDACGMDGLTRKYRVMCIDGALYPAHLAIGTDWKLHYFNAGMLEHPDRLAEDQAFMENMQGVLGPRVMAALRQINATLGLDYGGIDFGLNPSGEILVFEANACMAIFPPDEDPRYHFRRAGLEQICRAVRTMLVSRSGVAA